MFSVISIIFILTLVFLYQLRGNKIERLEEENKQLKMRNEELMKHNHVVNEQLSKTYSK